MGKGKSRKKAMTKRGLERRWSVGMLNTGKSAGFNRNTFTELAYTHRAKSLTVDEKMIDAYLAKKRGNALHQRLNGTDNPKMTQPLFEIAGKLRKLREEIPHERHVVIRRAEGYVLRMYFNDKDRVCFFIEENTKAWWVRRSVSYMPVLNRTARERALEHFARNSIKWIDIIYIEREVDDVLKLFKAPLPGNALNLALSEQNSTG